MDNNTQVLAPSNAGTLQLEVVPKLLRQDFVECTPTSDAGDPAKGC